MDDLLNDARSFILRDSSVIRELGEPLEVGRPFSQSSSTMNINGQVSSKVQSSFEVRGSYGTSGVATLDAINGKISNLNVNINGRYFNVDIMERGSVSGKDAYSQQTLGRNKNIGKDDFIDVDFVEKK